MRRLLSFVLVVAMVLSVTPVAVFATDNVTEVSSHSELVTALAKGGDIKLTAGYASQKFDNPI